MSTFTDNARIVAVLVTGLLAFWFLSGVGVKAVSEYLYLKRWSGHWGQVDSCIGFFAANALESGTIVDYLVIQSECEKLVGEGEFYMGYPRWRWVSSQELGMDDPIGSLHRAGR